MICWGFNNNNKLGPTFIWFFWSPCANNSQWCQWWNTPLWEEKGLWLVYFLFNLLQLLLGFKNIDVNSNLHIFISFLKKIGLFIWLRWVLVAALRIFNLCFCMRTLRCSMWDLVSWPEIKPGSSVLEARSLSHWVARDVPHFFINEHCTLHGG